MGVNSHLYLVGSEVLDGVGHSGIAVEAQYYKLLRELLGCESCDLRSGNQISAGWKILTARLRLVFVNPLPDHLH